MMANSYGGRNYDTSYSSTTYSDIGSSTSSTMYYEEAPKLDYDFNKIKKELTPYSDYSISYDPERGRFIVNRGFEYQEKEFTTKRSALRFVKRWREKRGDIDRGIKIPIYDQYKEKAKARKLEKIRQQEEREALERERERLRVEAEKHALWMEAIRKKRIKQKKKEDELWEEETYLERLGVWDG